MRTLLVLGDAGGRVWWERVRPLLRELPEVRTHDVWDADALAAALGEASFDAALVCLGVGGADEADGEALAHQMKQRLPDRPVVLLVDEMDEERAVAALRSGVDDYVVATPERLRRLPTALAAALARGETSRRAWTAEAALRESEQKLRLLVDQLACHLWTTDTELRVTSVAGAALPAVGVDPARYVGAAVPEVTGGAEDPVRAHERALAGGVERYDRTFLGRSFEAQVQPLRDREGRIVGCLGLALDVTERRRVERRLTVQRTIGHLLGEASDLERAAPEILQLIGEAYEWDYGGLWVVDWAESVLRCTATWWRDPRDKGPSRFEALSRQATFAPGVGLPGMVWASGQPRWIASTKAARFPRLRRARNDGLRSGLAVPVRSGGQTVGVLELLSREARPRDGEQMGAMASLATHIGQLIDRRRAERRAELEQLRRGFVQTVSHDLRTPLTAARAGLGLLAAKLASRMDPEERRLTATVQRNVGRLETFLDDLLALNRLETGVLALSKRDLDLRTVIEDATASLEPVLREKDQATEVEATEPLPCTGDARQLVRAVGNLLYSAHLRASRGSRVSVIGVSADTDVRVSIRDDGPTLLAEDLDRALATDREQPETVGASGFGLAVARRIVELHGGRLWAESPPSGGAAFHVALPRRR